MRKYDIILIACGLTALEALLIVSSGGLSSPLALVSLVPFVAGGAGIILAARRLRTSDEPAEIVQKRQSPAIEIPTFEVPASIKPSFNETDGTGAVAAAPCFTPSDPRVYEYALPALFTSITDYLNQTSDPMSETLVKIKTAISGYLTGVNRIKDSFEGNEYTANLQTGIVKLRTHITDMTHGTSKAFAEISGEIERLSDQMTSILELVSSISDVAERIHILSINASIEAARAGAHGKGFKVIANEIQKLSKETQTFVTTIGSTAGTTNKVFASLHGIMEKRKSGIERLVIEDSSTYDEITKAIEHQLADFIDLHSSIVKFIESIEVDMTTLSPLAMLHAIITQEIENLGKINADLVALLKQDRSDPASFAKSLGDRETVERLRARLTTARELDALEETLQKLGLKNQYDLKRNNTDIELF